MKSLYWSTWIWILFTIGCATQKKSHLDTREQNMLRAKSAFDLGDYSRSVYLFLELRREYPNDPIIYDYLTQSLIARSSVNIINIYERILSAKDSHENKSDLFVELIDNLPEPNDILRSDLREAIRILEEFNATHDSYLKLNETIYRMIYTFYLLKNVVVKLEQQYSGKIEDLSKFSKVLFVESNSDVVDIFHQLNMTLKNIDNITGKAQEKIKKLLPKKQLSFKHKKTVFKINLEKGLKKGLEDFIQKYMNSIHIKPLEQRFHDLEKSIKEKRNLSSEKLLDAKNKLEKLKLELESLQSSDNDQNLRDKLDELENLIKK
jgi:hypothetical protein